MNNTVGAILAQVEDGESRVFPPQIKGCSETEFLAVRNSFEYSPQIDWTNTPNFHELPNSPYRQSPRKSIFAIELPILRFKATEKRLVDYYWSNEVHFVSDRLADLIEKIDPDSIDRRPVSVQTKDGLSPFNAVMPKRTIEAIDTNKTKVEIQSKMYGSYCAKHAYFPNGAVLDHAKLIGVHNFTEIDTREWIWSSELIKEAKSAGVRGILTRPPASMNKEIDNF